MPKLLTTKKRRRPKPPCGRIIEYSVPHSPFQKLVYARYLEKQLTWRELSKMMKAAGAPTSSSSLWIWTHNLVGYPAPQHFTPKQLAALSSCLEIPIEDLRRAYDASRHIFTEKANPVPHTGPEILDTLMTILKNDKRTYIRIATVIRLLERLLHGTTVSK